MAKTEVKAEVERKNKPIESVEPSPTDEVRSERQKHSSFWDDLVLLDEDIGDEVE